jgi:hypothetical protein
LSKQGFYLGVLLREWTGHREARGKEKRNTNVICKIWKICVEKKPNIKVHSATSYLIFQYLQYWYNQYFPEYSSICNTGIISISQNPPVSAILVLPVFPRIFRYLQYSYFANDQYLLVLQILENSGRYWDTSIYQYLYQYCRYWKILVKYWYYQYCVPVL